MDCHLKRYYTVLDTTISQIITTIITCGIGALIGPKILSHAKSMIGTAAYKGWSNFASKIAGSTVGHTAISFFTSVIKEIGEEIFVDPVIELITKQIVRDLGGDQYAEIIWSTLAESGRETLTGGITSLVNIRTSQAQNEMALQFIGQLTQTKGPAGNNLKRFGSSYQKTGKKHYPVVWNRLSKEQRLP